MLCHREDRHLYKSMLTHEEFVFGELQLLHGDHVFTINCCLQCSLVDQIFQVSAGKAHSSPSNNLGLDGCRGHMEKVLIVSEYSRNANVIFQTINTTCNEV